jgi:hypothetical protein
MAFAKVTQYSILLFILVMDPLMQILDIAIRHELLHETMWLRHYFKVILYADNAAIFVAPLEEDMQNLTTSAK